MKRIISIFLLFTYTFIMTGCDMLTPQHTHDYGRWRTVKEPTCIEEGIERRVCNCGSVDEKAIEATGHVFGDWKIAVSPTYSATGREERACTCGVIESREMAMWTILLDENFDGDTLDKSVWRTCPEWVRHDGINVWEKDLAYLDGEGHLVLRAEWDSEAEVIRSGAIRSMGLFEAGYGYYEASIKFPVVEGVWGAFWLMCGEMDRVDGSAADGVEIDIIETIRNEQGLCNSALHYDGYGIDLKSFNSGSKYYNIYDGEFHTFALDRDETGYTFYIDGEVTWRVAASKCAPCPEDGFIKLTLEASKFAGAGSENCLSSLPAEMIVDYVRVYPANPHK